MAKLPNINVRPLMGFFLRPRGAAGSEAIVYLPAFNDAVRQQLIDKGYKMLSEARGDFSEKGRRALVIRPPNDEGIRDMIAELRGRVKSEQAKLDGEIQEIEQRLADHVVPGEEAWLYQTRLRQLQTRRKSIANEQPSFAEAKQYFLNEHRIKVAMDVPAHLRVAVQRMAEEREWARLAMEAEKEIEAETVEV